MDPRTLVQLATVSPFDFYITVYVGRSWRTTLLFPEMRVFNEPSFSIEAMYDDDNI
jgi:hypothetical protein